MYRKGMLGPKQKETVARQRYLMTDWLHKANTAPLGHSIDINSVGFEVTKDYNAETLKLLMVQLESVKDFLAQLCWLEEVVRNAGHESNVRHDKHSAGYRPRSRNSVQVL